MTPVVGLDLSARGSAAVYLDGSGQIRRAIFFSSKKTLVKKYADHNGLFEGFLSPDCAPYDESAVFQRTINTVETIMSFIAHWAPAVIGIEQIPFSATGQHRDQLYDLHALLRYAATSGGLAYKEAVFPLRYYLATDAKIYATGKGNSLKPAMIAAAEAEGWELEQFGKSAEDLADAYWIARMLQTELALRDGSLNLMNLSNEHLRVFNKPPVMKKGRKEPAPGYLDRPFLQLTAPAPFSP